MLSLITSTRGAFKAAMAVGALTLTVAGASLATTAPAEAFVRPGPGFHGGFGHRFGAVGFRHRGFAFRPYGYGFRRFGYRPYRFGRVFRPYGFRYVRPVARVVRPSVYARPAYHRVFPRYAYRPVRIVRPVVYPRVVRPYRFGYHRWAYGAGRPIGGYRHTFRHVGFGGRPFVHPVHRLGYAGHPFGGHGLRRL